MALDWKALRIDGPIRTVGTIHLSKTNVNVSVVTKNGGLSEQTVFTKIKVIMPGTQGKVLDYNGDGILVQFPSGHGWDTFDLFIKRVVCSQLLANS